MEVIDPRVGSRWIQFCGIFLRAESGTREVSGQRHDRASCPGVTFKRYEASKTNAIVFLWRTNCERRLLSQQELISTRTRAVDHEGAQCWNAKVEREFFPGRCCRKIASTLLKDQPLNILVKINAREFKAQMMRKSRKSFVHFYLIQPRACLVSRRVDLASYVELLRDRISLESITRDDVRDVSRAQNFARR